MIHLIVTLKAHTGQHEILKKYLVEITELSQREQDVIQYDYFLHPTATDTFLIYERLENSESLAKHNQSKHFLEITPKIQAIVPFPYSNTNNRLCNAFF